MKLPAIDWVSYKDYKYRGRTKLNMSHLPIDFCTREIFNRPIYQNNNGIFMYKNLGLSACIKHTVL